MLGAQNASAPTSQPDNPPPDCSTVNLEYDIALAIVSVTMGLFGLVYTFVGYRCFKAVLFLSGLTFGGTIVYVLCQEERILQHTLPFGAVIGIAVGVGVLCGLITMLVINVGLFLQGFFLGVLLAVAGIIAMSKFYYPSTPWVPVGILFGTGIVFALLTLKWQKLFVIISTSVMGAALICSCIEYFMEKFLLHKYIWETFMADTSIQLCWISMVILGIWPVLSLLGILIQWKFTGKGYDHTDVIVRRGDRSRVRTHLVRHPNRCTSPAARPPDRPRPHRDHNHTPSGLNNRNRGATPDPDHGRVEVTQQNEYNFDALPPSYEDCVRLGVGRPLREGDHNRIIRTKHGSFLAASGRHFRTPVDPVRAGPGRRSARSADAATPSGQPRRTPTKSRRTADPSAGRRSQRQDRGRPRRTPSSGARKWHAGSSDPRTPHGSSAPAGARRVSLSDDRQSLLINEERVVSSVRSRSR